MKLTRTLFQQHVGKMFRRHWKVQGKRVIYDNGAIEAAKQKGLDLDDPLEFVKERPAVGDIGSAIEGLPGWIEKELTYDETHPDYHEERCLTYTDRSVLVEGLKQAQVLTNTLVLSSESLPINSSIYPDQELPLQDKLVKRCIRSSLLYDATQEKLPKRHDPTREAWIFPRDYGIPDHRRNSLLVNRLLQLCASFSPQLLGQRSVINSAKFAFPLTLPSQQKILFDVTGHAVVMGDASPPTPPKQQLDAELPDIYPLEPTVSLESTNIYKFQHQFPVSDESRLANVHTVVIHYNETEVANIFETPVSVDQILGRSLVYSWIVAMCQARKDGKPVTVQSIQTDGKFFHFSVFHLSSTSLDSSAPRNLFWSFPLANIFEECSYIRGVPTLTGYNPSVFKTLLAFYNNS